MGQISNKIAQLKNVKANIRQAIIDAGITVPDDATFLDYADLIKSFEKGGLSYGVSSSGINAPFSQLKYTITIEDATASS